MKKLQKFLMATVLVSMLVGIFAVGSSAAEMEPSHVLADFDGSQNASASTGSQLANVSMISKASGNTYYEMDFVKSGANVNFGGSNYAFLGKGDYIVTEFDFMAEDWNTVSNILIGWNSRNSTGGALNDMHFSFSNSNGAPTISGNPLAGSITLDPTPGVWHHFTLIVQIGGEHVVKANNNLTAVKGQDAVEAYAYVDGQFFAKNLIGDGKEFWSTDTTYFQTLRLTANGGNQKLCFDNVYVAQYQTTKELRDFFKYRQKNNGEFPDLNAVAYPFVNYHEDYEYPVGTATLKVVELNGNETFFDRFDKAAKKAAAISGSKLVLLGDINNATVNYPITVDLAGHKLNYTLSPSLRAEAEARVNPITGEKSSLVSFIKKTKYAYFTWEVDHTGEKLDSRGYTPIALGAPVKYDGYELSNEYYLDGKLYVFTGEWKLDGAVLSTVPAYAVNSYYRLVPVINVLDVYAIIVTDEGASYVTDVATFASMVKSAPAGAVVTLVRDIALDAPLSIEKSITLDLAGKTLALAGADSAIVLTENAAGTVITSSEEGGKLVSEGALFHAAAAFTVNGENLVGEGTALLKTDVALSGVQFNGGAYVLSGATAILIGEEASASVTVNAALIAKSGAAVALADPQAAYAITLGGAVYGIALPASEVSEILLADGVALNGVSAALGYALPAGIRLADEALAIASKKTEALYGGISVETAFVVADKTEVALIEWGDGVSEYYAVGETIYHLYPDYYDAKKFYTPNGSYKFLLDNGAKVGNEILADYAGLTVAVAPCFDSFGFFVVAVKPDGTHVHYETAINLSTLLSSDEFEAGTVFALGRDNMLLKNAVISGAYAINLNGHSLFLEGQNKLQGALTVFSTLEGAAFYSDATQALLLEGGTLVIENVLYAGTTLVDLDAASKLQINGGAFFIEEGNVLYRAADGAEILIEALSADKELFAAADGYAWMAVTEEIDMKGQIFNVTAKYAKVSE